MIEVAVHGHRIVALEVDPAEVAEVLKVITHAPEIARAAAAPARDEKAFRYARPCLRLVAGGK